MLRQQVRKERTFTARRCAPLLFLPLGLLVIAPPSRAQINLGPITVGGGIQTDYEHTQPANGSSTDQFQLNSARIYINGPVTDAIKFMLNTEYDQPTNKI